MVRSAAIIFGIGLTLGLATAAWAGPPLEYPRPCPNGCVPNVMGFGHFKTTWRQWPGEERLEQTNPRAIGAQVLPTPSGQEQLPLPRPAAEPQPPSPAPDGGVMPPADNQIPESILPDPPAEPKAENLFTPPNGGTLPGLPTEPNGSTIPDHFDAGQAPGSALDSILPSTPAAKEPTKPTEDVKPKEESKPKQEPKAKKEPTPAGASKPTASMVRGNTEPIAAAAPMDKKQQGEPHKATALLAADDADYLRSLRLGSYRPEPAVTTTAQGPTKNIEPARYATAPTRDVEPARYAPTNRAEPATYATSSTVEPPTHATARTSTVEPATSRPASIVNLAHDATAPTSNVERATYATEPANRVEPAAYATAESAGQLEVTDEQPGLPVALNGYCPVELVTGGRWLLGDLRWTVVHQGYIYRLSGPTQRQQFMANPEAFTPAYSGNDPVLAIDQHRMVPGQTVYCATYNNRLYMFSNAATQAQFNQNPQQYIEGR